MIAAGLAVGGPASAVGVDGRLDPEYGPALAIQTNNYPDLSQAPRGMFADHTELDALHAYWSADHVLHVFVAGNLRAWIGAIDPTPAYDYLFLMVDAVPGGQHTLRSDNPQPGGLGAQHGLTFETGFDADYALVAWSPSMCCTPSFELKGFYAALTAGGASGYELGTNDGLAPGTLTGGTNPNGIQLAIANDDTTGGVTAGCGAGSGAGVSRGVEWAIPMAAIGSPTHCVRLTVYACFLDRYLENQVLPPVAAGTCTLGAPSGVDFSSFEGVQFVTVCPSGVPVKSTTWGRLKSAYR